VNVNEKDIPGRGQALTRIVTPLHVVDLEVGIKSPGGRPVYETWDTPLRSQGRLWIPSSPGAKDTGRADWLARKRIVLDRDQNRGGGD
jgi:hypothetical protein